MTAPKWLLLCAAAIIVVAAILTAFSWFPGPQQTGDPLAAAFPDLAGNNQQLAQWRGKVLVINFWATWCPPCLEEIPDFIAWQQQYGSEGLQIIGIAVDDAKAVRQFLQRRSLNYPVLLAPNKGMAWSALLGNVVGILPFSAVFDRSGRLLYGQPGRVDRRVFDKYVKNLLN